MGSWKNHTQENGVRQALSSIGLHALANFKSHASVSANHDAYRSAWHLEDWTLPYDETNSHDGSKLLYSTMCKLRQLGKQNTIQDAEVILRRAYQSLHDSELSSGNRASLLVFSELEELLPNFQNVVSILKMWRDRSQILTKVLT